jgi:hypothetical protein
MSNTAIASLPEGLRSQLETVRQAPFTLMLSPTFTGSSAPEPPGNSLTESVRRKEVLLFWTPTTSPFCSIMPVNIVF